MRETLERVIEANPEVVIGILCKIWEDQIEAAKVTQHVTEAAPDCRCRHHKKIAKDMQARTFPSSGDQIQGMLF